jgi:hypothetical protein
MPNEIEPTADEANSFKLGPNNQWVDINWGYLEHGEIGTYLNFSQTNAGNVPTGDPPHGVTRMYVKADGNLYFRAHGGVETLIDPAAAASGYSGRSGYSGSGVSGYSGESNVSGFSGYSGSGVSGYSGEKGTSGYSGSGVSGYSGEKGTSGYSGATGPLNWVAAPTTAADAGVAGQIAYDATHIYICLASGNWVRDDIETWGA